MDTPYKSLIEQTYAAFNARDIDRALSVMHEKVEWPKAWEGGFVTGHDAIRDYWTRQWKEVSPNVKPVGFTPMPGGSLQIDVHQKVKDLQGNVVFDGMVKHIYTFEDGLIRRMVISK